MANTTLRHVTNFHQPLVSNNIESNIMAFFDWGLLNVGGFYNVTVSTSGTDGGNFSRLRADNFNFPSGKVWEGVRKQWIWESGLSYNISPISISGVNVNANFYPIGTTGQYSYHIDYPNGRVIFDNPINSASVVSCEYSYRHYQFYNGDAPWWKELQRNSFRVDSEQFLMSGSGAWSKPPEQRIQLPAIVIEASPAINRTPYEIGHLSHYHNQEVRFHVITENNYDATFAHDVITNQWECTIASFDKNKLISSGVFPLNQWGDKQDNAMCYPELANRYNWKDITLKEFRSWLNDNVGLTNDFQSQLPVYYSTIRGIVQVIL